MNIKACIKLWPDGQTEITWRSDEAAKVGAFTGFSEATIWADFERRRDSCGPALFVGNHCSYAGSFKSADEARSRFNKIFPHGAPQKGYYARG